MPSVVRVSSSGRSFRFLPVGICAVKPAMSAGVISMKMIRSTNMTSTIGVMLMSAITLDFLLAGLLLSMRASNQKSGVP